VSPAVFGRRNGGGNPGNETTCLPCTSDVVRQPSNVKRTAASFANDTLRTRTVPVRSRVSATRPWFLAAETTCLGWWPAASWAARALSQGRTNSVESRRPVRVVAVARGERVGQEKRGGGRGHGDEVLGSRLWARTGGGTEVGGGAQSGHRRLGLQARAWTRRLSGRS
jgi:hypothetical protein